MKTLSILSHIAMFLVSAVVLSAQVGLPIRINENEGNVTFSGTDGFRRVGEEIHLTYLEHFAEHTEVKYSRLDLEGNILLTSVVDEYDKTDLSLGSSVIEVLDNGRIIVFYPRLENVGYDYAALYQTELSSEGSVISTTMISSGVFDSPSVAKVGNQVHLVYKTGLEKGMNDYGFVFDQHLNLNDDSRDIAFGGGELTDGKIYSDSDFWIGRSVGGANDGWPIFNEVVKTSGIVRVSPGGGTNFPLDQIFRGGLIENYAVMQNRTPSTDLVRQNGRLIGGSAESDNKIAFVTIDDEEYTLLVGERIQNGYEEYTVYDSYPPYGEIGNTVGTNYIPVIDTIWSAPVTGTLRDGSAFVPFELWISGNFSGRQTWGSSHNIYIKDDITLSNTEPGTSPENNDTDIVALVSDKSIIVQYGHWCPIDQVRKKPNTDGVYIYAHLYASGDGNGDSRLDGVFTYQYQFPKGSTPDQYWDGDLYTDIDLHRFFYPTSEENPWPAGLDYPWYNPLWPEPGPVFDQPDVPNPEGLSTVDWHRGTITLYGSINSRRAGYYRRSGNPSDDTGDWDIENGIYGRWTDSQTGYDLKVYADERSSELKPLDTGNRVFLKATDQYYGFRYAKSDEIDDNLIYIDEHELLSVDRPAPLVTVDGERIIAYTGFYVLYSDENGENFNENRNIEVVDRLTVNNDQVYYLQVDWGDLHFARFIHQHLSSNTSSNIFINRAFYDSRFALSSYDDQVVLAAIEGDDLVLEYYDSMGSLVREQVIECLMPFTDNFSRENSVLDVTLEDGHLLAFIYNEQLSGKGDIYLLSGNLDAVSVDQNIVPTLPTREVSHFPNPVALNQNTRSANVTFSFSLNKPSEVIVSVYNVKGQLVKALAPTRFSEGSHQLNWDGRDERGRVVPKGSYFYQVRGDDFVLSNKMIIID